MRLRTLVIAAVVTLLCTGLAWLILQPVLLRLLDGLARLSSPGSPERVLVAQLRRALPVYLALDLALATLVTFVVLHLTVLRPLRDTERAIDELGRTGLRDALPLEPSGGGVLVSRVRSSLRRLTDALRAEQATTQSQVRALRASNEQLARTQLELVSSERLATVGRLAAGVAHEVGNPLSGVLGYLSLARGKTADPELLDYLGRSEAELQRIDQIVRGLLDLGRAPRGEPEVLELRAVVDDCVRLVRQGPELRDVELEVEIDRALLVRGEPGPLAQIQINLLLNAGQAMAGRGRVRLHAAAAEGTVRLHVDDTGPGISAEALPRLFEPFFTTKPSGKGTGLGLAVSRHLAEAMGGRLTGANQPGGGARFTLELPRA